MQAIKVGLLTEAEKDLIYQKEYTDNSFYNPFQDATGQWVISIQEMQDTTITEFLWVKDLPLIDWTGYYIPSGTTENI